MILKTVVIFLVGMVVLAIFGRIRFPGQDKLAKAQCSDCGRYRIGRGPCTCKGGNS